MSIAIFLLLLVLLVGAIVVRSGGGRIAGLSLLVLVVTGGLIALVVGFRAVEMENAAAERVAAEQRQQAIAARLAQEGGVALSEEQTAEHVPQALPNKIVILNNTGSSPTGSPQWSAPAWGAITEAEALGQRRGPVVGARVSIAFVALTGIAIVALVIALARRARDERRGGGLILTAVGACLVVASAVYWLSARPRVAPRVNGSRSGAQTDSAEEYYDRFTAPQIQLDSDSPARTATGQPQAMAAPPALAAEVREMLQQSGLDQQIAGDASAGAGSTGLGRYAKDAVIIMWLGDPTPFEALRNAPTNDPNDLAAVPSEVEAAPEEPGELVSNTTAAEPAPAVPNAPQPEWLDATNDHLRTGRQAVLSTDPFSTLDECRLALLLNLDRVIAHRIARIELAESGETVDLPSLQTLGLRTEGLVEDLVSGEYVENVATSVGTMKRAHMLVEFSPETDEQLLAAWRNFSRRQRMFGVGLLASGVIGAVALVFGLLKVDTWTRGYYTKRLFLGVPAAIIGLLALLGLA